MTAQDLVKKLMAKAGITYDGDLTQDIPEEVVTNLDNQLLTIAAATNNHPQVKKVYFAQAYNGLDAEINELISEFGLTEEVKAEILAAGGSTKKAVALARKVKEVTEKSVPADKDAAKKHADQITELNNKLAAEIKKQTELKATYDGQLKNIQVQTKVGGILGGYKTVYDDLPAEAKEAAISALITKSLQDSEAEFTFDDKGNLSLVKKDGTNLFGENHTLITPQSFIDKSLSKILKVTDPKSGNNPSNPAPPIQPGTGGQNQPNTALKAAIAESQSSYEEASKNRIAV